MYFRSFAAIVAVFTLVAATSAEARRSPHQSSQNEDQSDDEARPVRHKRSEHRSSSEGRERRHVASARHHNDDGDDRGEHHSGLGARPGAWCGWFMRTRHGGGPEMNLAANWRHYGSAGSPQIGAIVVWPHHVGEIVGKADNGQWIVLSGNDGNAVRRRPRSIAGAVIRT